MTTNRNFAHVTAVLTGPAKDMLKARVARDGLRSLTAAVRAELEEQLATQDDFGPVLAPPASRERDHFWLPRELVQQVRAIAKAQDATPSNLITTILALAADDYAAGRPDTPVAKGLAGRPQTRQQASR